MSLRNYLFGAALALLATSACAEEAAKTPPPPMGISLLTVDINPGGAGAFEQFMAKYIEAANKVNLAAHWSASESDYGGPANFGFARPFWSFAELGDDTDPLVKAFGQDEAMKLGQSIRGSVAAIHNEIYRLRPDLSRPAPASKDPVVAFIALLIDIKPGTNAAYESYVKKIVEASNKTNQANWMGMSAGPGAQYDYVVVITYTSWAAIDKPVMPIPERLTTAFGKAEGEKIYAEGSALITNLSTMLRRTRPDLARPMPQ